MLVLFNKMKQFFKTYFLDNKKKILQAILVVVGVIFILLRTTCLQILQPEAQDL